MKSGRKRRFNRCRKCLVKIPRQVIIRGRKRNLCNRKFCLSCSPFGKHNTKSDDPASPSKPKVWSEKPLKARKAYHKQLLKRAHERKARLVKMFGGGCSSCGYDKNMRGLGFIRRRGRKAVELNAAGLWSHTWDAIVGEAGKCRLLCMNCITQELDNRHAGRRSHEKAKA